MHIVGLKISCLRGVRPADIAPGRHVALVDANKSGDTTFIEALAQHVGRDRLMRSLTEHDFHGSAPDETARIPCGATAMGFTPNGPRHHPSWFSPECGVENLSGPKAQALIEHQYPARSQGTAFPKSIEG